MWILSRIKKSISIIKWKIKQWLLNECNQKVVNTFFHLTFQKRWLGCLDLQNPKEYTISKKKHKISCFFFFEITEWYGLITANGWGVFILTKLRYIALTISFKKYSAIREGVVWKQLSYLASNQSIYLDIASRTVLLILSYNRDWMCSSCVFVPYHSRRAIPPS